MDYRVLFLVWLIIGALIPLRMFSGKTIPPFVGPPMSPAQERFAVAIVTIIFMVMSPIWWVRDLFRR